VRASNISPITGTANIGAATKSNKSATTEIERAVNALHLKAVGYTFGLRVITLPKLRLGAGGTG